MNEIEFEKKGKKAKIFKQGTKVKIKWNKQTGEITSASKDVIYLSGIEYNGKNVDGFSTEKAEEIQDLVNKARKEAEEKESEKYKNLYQEMEKISLPQKNKNPDDEKAQELLSTMHEGFEGEESDGLNLAVASGNAKIRKKAQRFCNHNFKIKYNETYTSDARKKLERTVECEKCGFFKKDSVEDELSENAIWS